MVRPLKRHQRALGSNTTKDEVELAHDDVHGPDRMAFKKAVWENIEPSIMKKDLILTLTSTLDSEKRFLNSVYTNCSQQNMLWTSKMPTMTFSKEP